MIVVYMNIFVKFWLRPPFFEYLKKKKLSNSWYSNIAVRSGIRGNFNIFERKTEYYHGNGRFWMPVNCSSAVCSCNWSHESINSVDFHWNSDGKCWMLQCDLVRDDEYRWLHGLCIESHTQHALCYSKWIDCLLLRCAFAKYDLAIILMWLKLGGFLERLQYYYGIASPLHL